MNRTTDGVRGVLGLSAAMTAAVMGAICIKKYEVREYCNILNCEFVIYW